MIDPKREIFDILYRFDGSENVLDVGCGVPNPMLMYHGVPPKKYTGIDLKNDQDWYNYSPGKHDVIIANDLFPNVDQRLELFLNKYLPHCKQMRLSLTYFDKPYWYRAVRSGGEVVTMMAWNRDQLHKTILNVNTTRFFQRISIKDYEGEFPNGRRVILVWIEGGLE
jgi:hypothetical protein